MIQKALNYNFKTMDKQTLQIIKKDVEKRIKENRDYAKTNKRLKEKLRQYDNNKIMLPSNSSSQLIKEIYKDDLNLRIIKSFLNN